MTASGAGIFRESDPGVQRGTLLTFLSGPGQRGCGSSEENVLTAPSTPARGLGLSIHYAGVVPWSHEPLRGFPGMCMAAGCVRSKKQHPGSPHYRALASFTAGSRGRSCPDNGFSSVHRSDQPENPIYVPNAVSVWQSPRTFHP